MRCRLSFRKEAGAYQFWKKFKASEWRCRLGETDEHERGGEALALMSVAEQLFDILGGELGVAVA